MKDEECTTSLMGKEQQKKNSGGVEDIGFYTE